MKHIKRLFLVILALAFAVALFACTDEPICLNHRDTDGDGLCETCNTAAETVATASDIVLFKNGDINFQFVVGTDVSRAVLNKLKGLEDILSDFGITLTVAEDKESTTQECEVLIGDVISRGDAYRFDKYSLGPEGYLIKIVDKKLIITAGSSDSLLEAVQEFIADILKINGDTESINNIIMKPSQNKHVTQNEYEITSVKIGDTSIENYGIATDMENETYLETAAYIQDVLYNKAGIWLPIVPLTSETENLIILAHRDIDATPADSFRILSYAGTLYIETEYDNSLLKNTKSFIDEKITTQSGDVNIASGILVQKDVSIVTYEEFGALGDGRTNDFLAIKDAHDYANISGQKVLGNPNATYYISKTTVNERLFYISIRTNTDWQGAKFIIDDTNLTQVEMSKQCESPIIKIESHLSPIATTVADREELNKKFKLGRDTTRIDLELGYSAMVLVKNQNHKICFRQGANPETGGDLQQELVCIDENGYVLPSTRLLYDYDEITHLTIYRTDIEEITVENATFTTKASRVDSTIRDPNGSGLMVAKYNTPFDRGICVARSNTNLVGIKHYVEGEYTPEDHKNEELTGANYLGFFSVTNAANVLLKDCVLSGRRFFGIGESRDFAASYAANLTLENCDQHNFYIDDAETVLSTATSVAGIKNYDHIAELNYSKNIEFNDCTLSSFICDKPIFTAKISNSLIGKIALIGGGDLLIDNTTVEDKNFFSLVTELGASWEGEIHIKDSTLKTTVKSPNIFTMVWTNNDFGYTCSMPNIILENISKTSSGTTFKLVSTSDPSNKDQDSLGSWDKLHVLGAERPTYVPNPQFHQPRKTNINPLTPPKYIIVTSNSGGYKYTIVDNPIFDNTFIRGFEGYNQYDPDEIIPE